MPNSTVRYTPATRWFHWLAFAAVALAYLFINLKGVFPRGTPASKVPMQGHILFGLAVLALVHLPFGRAGIGVAVLCGERNRGHVGRNSYLPFATGDHVRTIRQRSSS